MAITTTPYCTLADVISALGPTASNLSQADQNWLTALIPDAQSAMDGVMNRHFGWQNGTTANPVTMTYDGYNSDHLMIDECLSVSQVMEVAPFALLNPANNTVIMQNGAAIDITNDCLLGPYNNGAKGVPYIFLKRKSGLTFMQGTQNYTVTGVWGRPDVPGEIHRAAVRMLVYWFHMRKTNYASSVSQQGTVTQHYHPDIPPDVMGILQRNARRMIGSR